MTLLSGLAELHDLDVDSTHFYFSDGNLVERCAKDTPCEGAARTPLADFTGLNQDGTGSLAVHDGSIVFFGNTTAHTGIYGCPVTGCTTSGSLRSSLNGYDPFIAWSGDQALVFESAHGLKSNQCSQGVCAASVTRTTGAMSDAPLTATDTDYYFTRVASGANAALSRCPISEIPCTTVTDVSTVTNAQKLAATDQYLFVMWPGGQGGGTAVGYCGLAGCPDGALPTKLRASINTFVDMTAIHDRAFWIDDAGSIQTCSIASCVAPRTLASSLVDASQIVADDAFVYWIEGAGGAAGSIHRVAY